MPACLQGIHLRPGRLTFHHQRPPPQSENPPGRGASQQRQALISFPDGGVDRGDTVAHEEQLIGEGKERGEVGERGVLNECQTRVELFSGVEQPIIKNMSQRKKSTLLQQGKPI